MFSKIAAITFEKGAYFIKQEELENYIADFIRNLHNVKEETLQPDSEDILKGIAAHHGIFVERAKGIYSFAHLTFQEYFTAKYIVDNATKGTLRNLVENHLLDDGWREVFLLTAELLPESDDFLAMMRKYIKELEGTEVLAKLLKKIPRVIKKGAPLPGVICRGLAILEILGCTSSCDLGSARTSTNASASTLAIASARALGIASDLVGSIASTLNIVSDPTVAVSLAKARTSSLSHALTCARALALDEADCLHVANYLQANSLLLTHLSSECYVSKDVREDILEDLLTLE